MYNSFIVAEPVFNFPHGLKNNIIYKKESLRIKYLYTKSYGVAEKDIHDKSDIEQLNNLVTTAYIPYLQYCCQGNQPLVKTLGNTNIQIAHGGIQQGMNDINTTLNIKYTEFITNLPGEPLDRSALKANKLMGPSFYTDGFDVNISSQLKAAEIQTYVNLADTPAPEAIYKITGCATEYNGPIWTRFWQLNNNSSKNVLIGICGHAPLGKLPMVYQNNLCCDTTYANNGNPNERPPMSIRAELNSNECWKVDITLNEPVTAKFDSGDGSEDLNITSYCIHENNMTLAEIPQDVEDGKKLYQHFVGETMINGTTYSIWRTAKSAVVDNDVKFWRIPPDYILKIPSELTSSGVQDVDKEVFHIITDIEGNLDFFEKSLSMCHDGKLVLLGDIWDRGTVDQELKISDIIQHHKPICVVGNRDANKARWILELYNDFDWE